MTYSAPYGGAQGAGDLPVRPPVIRERVNASKKFFDANSRDQVVAAAVLIFQRRWGEISQFILGQRQMGMVLPASYKRMDYPDLSIEYQRLGNQETVLLTAYPETTQRSATIPIGSTFDIDAPFTGWPVPLYAYLAAGGDANVIYANGPRYINGIYFYDAMFTPGPVHDPNNTASDLNVGADMFGFVETVYIDAGLNFNRLTGFPEWSRLDPGSQFGFVKDWWIEKVGGSGFCAAALDGLQYWEVEVLELPVATPPTLTMPRDGVADGTYQLTPVGYLDPAQQRVIWPADLNTFYSPTIGLVPANFIDKTWGKNIIEYQGLIGLDTQPFPEARSIGVTRTSVMDGSVANVTWQNGFAYIENGLANASFDGTTWTGTPYPGKLTLPFNPTAHDKNPNVPLPATVHWASNGQPFLVHGKYILSIVTVGDGPPDGPDAAACAAAVGTSTLVFCGTAAFVVSYQVGDFRDVLLGSSSNPTNIYGEVQYQPGAFTTVSTPAQFGDTLTTLDGTKVTALNVTGKHAPVFKGRADALHSATPEQDAPIHSTNEFDQLTNGVWTGVDLGEIKVKDTIMVAADTSKRKVWFGKNGKWYDRAGVSQFQPGSPELQCATFMDGDATVLYYPACSFRLGPTRLRMKFAGAQKYLAPGGFQGYQAIPDVPGG